MTVYNCRVVYQKANVNDEPNPTPVDMTYAIDWSSARALDVKANGASLSLRHDWYRYVKFTGPRKFGGSVFMIDNDDSLTVYAAVDSPIDEGNSSHRLFTGKVVSFSQSYGDDGKSIVKVVATDSTSLLLNKLVSRSFTQKTAPQIIQAVIGEAAFEVYKRGFANMASLRHDGSAFPAKDMSLVNLSAFEWISNASAAEFLNNDTTEAVTPVEDKNYAFFIDRDGLFWWFYPSTTVNSSVYEGQEGLYSVSLGKSVYDSFNTVIFNAGTDKEGNGICWYHYDTNTTQPQLRYRFIDMKNIADNFRADFADQYAAMDNGEFRNKCKEIGGVRSQALINKTKGLRWKGTLVLSGDPSYEPGDLLSLYLPRFGMTAYPMRVIDVRDTFQNGSWATTLELEEDMKQIASVGN